MSGGPWGVHESVACRSADYFSSGSTCEMLSCTFLSLTHKASVFLSSPQLLSPQSGSVVLPFKKMTSATFCFCAEEIIILLGLMVPLNFLFHLVGGLIYSVLKVPISCYAVKLPFCSIVQTGSCSSCNLMFLSLVFPLWLWVLADLGETQLCPSCYSHGLDNGGQLATRLEESFVPRASCVLVLSRGLALALCDSHSVLA